MSVPRLLFDHQDGPLAFRIRRAVYHLSSEGHFSCSVVCNAEPTLAYMSEPSFCFMRYPTSATALVAGCVLRIDHRQGDRDDMHSPSTHLYAGAHFDPWDASVTLVSIKPGSMKAAIRFLTDDPKYYDERAKPTVCSCVVWLQQAAIEEVWDPC